MENNIKVAEKQKRQLRNISIVSKNGERTVETYAIQKGNIHPDFDNVIKEVNTKISNAQAVLRNMNNPQ